MAVSCSLSCSAWKFVPLAPLDPILDGLKLKFGADPSPSKVNLAIGVYRNENGDPIVHSTVREADIKIAHKNLDKEYASQSGIQEFCDLAFTLAFGQNVSSSLYKRCATLQTLSGSGALRVAGDFISKFYPVKQIWICEQTWPNHLHIYRSAGLEIKRYPYYNPKIKNLDIGWILDALRNKVPLGAPVLWQPCANNPTGCDPTSGQWRRIGEVMKEREQIPVLDLCYLGYGTGDLNKDRYAVDCFTELELQPIVCQSFAKNMGLYGERVGSITFVSNSEEEADRIMSQAKLIIRGMWSSPPIHGGRIVQEVLGNSEMREQFAREMFGLYSRLSNIRQTLVDKLAEYGSKCDWSHVTRQTGMFSYTGLTPDQCERLTKEFHIYLQDTGRISLTGLNMHNVDYVAKAIHEVTK